jgi:hypothetical protein
MCGSGVTAPHIIKYGTTRGKFSIAHNGQFTFEERAPDSEKIGSCLGSIYGLDRAKLKNLYC